MRWVVVLGVLLASSVAGAAEPITRERMLQTAAAFADHEWVCSAENATGGLACESTWVCDWEVDQLYVGLPYDWGGYVSVAGFDQDLADGLGAGSHDTWDPLPCTTGVDCSGYVSQCWEISHHSTATMDEVAHPIDPEGILPGDAWNRPSHHVVLWVREAENGAPVFYEAVGRPTSKVRLNDQATWSYLEGYTAIRADKLEAPPPLGVGTLENPIAIDAFPFVDDNNTALSNSRLWNSYACAPDTNESGPEIFYRLTLAQPGTLRVVVTDPEGVDVDPHLLSAADPNACLARNDTDFSLSLDDGEYWLVADTWVNGQGVELPGSYHLQVTFVPDGSGEPDGPDQAVEGADDASDLVGDDGTDPDDGVGAPDAAAEEDDGGGGSGGCLWIPASVGYGESLVVFGLLLGLGLVVRLVRRHRLPFRRGRLP